MKDRYFKFKNLTIKKSAPSKEAFAFTDKSIGTTNI